MYSSVHSASSDWDEAASKVESSSGEWNSAKTSSDSVYSTVQGLSSEWGNAYSTTLENSAEWEEATTRVHQASSTWESTSNKVSSISVTSDDNEYPSARCVYGIVGDVESSLETIIGGGVYPDLTIFATKAYPATSGHFASLDVSGNIEDSGWTASDFATLSAVQSMIGDINSVLDAINGEVI